MIYCYNFLFLSSYRCANLRLKINIKTAQPAKSKLIQKTSPFWNFINESTKKSIAINK